MALVGSSQPSDDPERLLDEWLGELDVLSAGLDASTDAPRIDSYRFSMANLEETQDADLDAILGELCALQTKCDIELSSNKINNQFHTRSHSDVNEKIFQPTVPTQTQSQTQPNQTPQQRDRTDSPDNDSAFSDTLSLLSSESSASSSISSKVGGYPLYTHQRNVGKEQSSQAKVEKIKLAMEKIKEASIKKLFIKAFSLDGSSKSLLVDEKMTCGYVTRLLADKNHMNMEPKWAIVECLPDLLMERVYEDHELLVDNLMHWTSDSKNKIIFCERPDKIALFHTPEKFLLMDKEKASTSEYDDHSRTTLLDDFFNDPDHEQGPSKNTTIRKFSRVPIVEGPLYLKSDIKKGWKKHHFVLRPSGIYYFAKEKVKNLKELVCLATFDVNEVYTGLGWRKKYKAPTEFCFAIKHPRLQQPKSVKFIKFLCADDHETLDRWITGMRIAKHGRQLFDNYKTLVEELALEDLDHLAQARATSVVSIAGGGASPGNKRVSSCSSSGRSSVSSGCLSDGSGTSPSETGFECDFPMGTIKRKPTMKPNIPLTSLSRQLRDAAGAADMTDDCKTPTRTEAVYTNNGTLTRVHSRNRSNQSADINITGRTSPGSRSITPVGSITRTLSHHTTSSTSSSLSSTKDLLSQSRSSEIMPEYIKNTNVTRNSCTDFNVNDTVPDSLKKQYCDIKDVRDVNDITSLVNNVFEDSVHATVHQMFSSTGSLDSLPLPPPPDCDMLDEMIDSQLSLPPPPPAFTLQAAAEVITSIDDIPEDQSLRGTKPKIEDYSRNSQIQTRPPPISFAPCIMELQEMGKRPSSQNEFFNSPPKSSSLKPNLILPAADKKVKRATVKFAEREATALEEPPALPAKPSPPKRNQATRLTYPKKLSDSASNPPLEFFKDLQRVMKKKWQVAQKCISEPTTTPHEVLGFREYPLSEDYKEASVSNWVEEHCGIVNQQDNLYENLDNIDNNCPPRATFDVKPIKKRPAPPPPKRSTTTQLSFPQNNVIYF